MGKKRIINNKLKNKFFNKFRTLLINLASNNKNFLGLDSYGTEWYAKTLEDGIQLWATVRNGLIRNGGINDAIREFHSQTGLCKPFKSFK